MTDIVSQETTDEAEVPATWVWSEIGNVAELIRGVSYKKADASTSPRADLTPILRANNIGDGRLNFDKLVYVPPHAISEKQYVRALDVIIAMSSGSKKLVGKAGQATNNYGCGFGAFCGLVRGSELLDKKYIGLFFQSELYKKAISRLSSGVNINNLRRQHIEEMPIPLAPLNEQRRIVEKIEELFTKLDAGVRSLEQARAQLKSYRRSVLKAAVEGELSREWREAHGDELESASELLERILRERREKFAGKKYKEPASPDTLELPKLPYKWQWVTWGQIGTSQNGRAFPSKEYSSSGVKLLRPGNLRPDGSVKWTEKNTRYMPEKWSTEHPLHLVGPRELVINLTAQSLADEFLGRVCLTGDDENCLLNQRIARLTPIEVVPEYLLWMFKSHVFRRYVDSLNTGSLIQHMFTTQVAEFVLPLPPIEEQRFIVQEVERRLSVVDKLEETVEASLKQANALRQSILKRAFSGELVPQDPDDEPAGVLLERIRSERQKTGSGRRARRTKVDDGGQERLI